MSQFVTALSAGAIATVVACGTAFMATPAAAASDADKAALKQATAMCKAQVKEQAHFEEMSFYARHKLVKKCVKDALAGH
jgi:NAD(P)H-dependent flavin oxidoreductase YrpB (nitropropane dioxygenase family)